METKNLNIQDTHKLIAIELMEEILKGKDVSTLLTRDRILELLSKIKEKGEGYYLIHQEINDPNSATVKKFEENKNVIFKSLVREIADRVQFDIEFYKHGKATNNLRKRFAIIIKNEGFWSSKSNQRQSNNKDKTLYVLKSTMTCERKSNQPNWANSNKLYRIVLEYADESKKTKKNYLYLYFENEKQQEQVRELLFAMKLMKKDNTNIYKSLNSMQKLIEGSRLFYAVLKLMDAKQKVKNRKILLNSLKNYTNESFKKLNGFMKGVCDSWLRKYKISKSSSAGVTQLRSTLPKNKIMMTNIKNHEVNLHFNKLSNLKTSSNLIANFISKTSINSKALLSSSKSQKILTSGNTKSITNRSMLQALANLNKFIGFKMLDTYFTGNLNKNQISEGNSTFDANKFLNSKWFTINKKQNQIQFNNLTSLSREDLRNISNIFVNLDNNNNYKDNFLIINGPKSDPKKFFKYEYKKNYLQGINSTDKFIEPEFHSLSYNQSNASTYRALYLQIFHSIFIFEKKDLQLLETHNNDNKNAVFTFNNPLEDFYFFLTIEINRKYNIRTKLVKALSYEKERFVIEFNLEHLLNLDSLEIFNPLDIKVSLNLIPSACFDLELVSEADRNLAVDYLKSYEMGFCKIDSEKISKRTFEFQFVKEGVNLPDENKIIMNISENDKLFNKSPTKFYGKMLTVGSEIYAIEELTKEFFENKMKDPNIDRESKEKFYNLNFSEDGCIYLRPPKFLSEFSSLKIENEKEFINEIKSEGRINNSELSNIFYNKQYDFIPNCEKFSTRKKFNEINSNLNSVNFYPEDALEVDKNLKQGQWVYKLKKIRKCFLSDFKGITENKNFYYHNYYTNNLMSLKLQNLHYDIKNTFRIQQENMFDIYDFSQIDKDTIENGNNYQWKIGIHFVNKNEMNAFIFFLKDLRRRVNFQDKRESLIVKKPIDLKILKSINQNLKKSVKSLKIIIDKLEFRKNFSLNENKSLQIKMSKTSIIPGANRLAKSMLESLDESETYGYKNSLIFNDDLMDDINILKNMKSDFKILPKEYDIDASKFNTSQKIIKFSDSLEIQNKLLEIDAKPAVDKMFNIEISFNGKQSTLKLNSIINFENIIFNKPQADIFIQPIHIGDDKTVYGILHLKAWSLDPGVNLKFYDIFNRYIMQLPKIPRDMYNNFVSLESFELNVLRRLITSQIRSQLNCNINSVNLDDNMSRNKLYVILEKYCVKFAGDLINGNWTKSDRWKYLEPDFNARHVKNIKKFYVNMKRNEFYERFSKSEWEIYFTKASSTSKGLDKSTKTDLFHFDNLYPTKSELLDFKLKKPNLFQELKFLYYSGIPPTKRNLAWEKILNIEKLVDITQERLLKENGIAFDTFEVKKENYTDHMKKEIYLYFANLVNSHSQFNINFSLIDIDLNFLSPISDSLNLNQIKFITKAYFLWSELNITTDKFVKGSDSENKRFVYFFGLLKIIQRLYSVFKDESQTFWIVIGLSQIIELFYQSDPLFSSELSYTKIYVLITKLIMQNHHIKIYNKFAELDFPIEFFIAKLIPTLYCDFLQTELFLRLLDIIIFEASLKTNSSDRYEYLRVICTVPLTLLKLNEKKILECLSVKEMEKTLDNLIKKSFNNQKFLELVRENSESYYEYSNILEKFVEYNSNTSWDWKRAKIQKKLFDFFNSVEKENKKYLSKLNVNLGSRFIESYEEEVRTKLNSIHAALASSTPGEEQKSSLSLMMNKSYLHFAVTNFLAFDDSVNPILFKPECINVYVDFDNKPTRIQEFYQKMKAPSAVLRIDYKDTQGYVNLKNSEVIMVGFPSIFPKYMNIYLFTENNNSILGEYHAEIRKLDFMSAYKLKLESFGNTNKSVIEVCLFKSSHEKIKDHDSDLYNFLFNQPNYLYDFKLDCEINGVDASKLKISDEIAKGFAKSNGEFLQALTYELQITNKFFVEEFKKNYLISKTNKLKFLVNENSEIILDRVEEMLTNIFADREDIVKCILSWVKTNDSSFEEIMCALILSDTSSVTIYDKLKLIFDVCRMKNYLINNEDSISVSKLKEMIYNIYKRYMVYFTKSDVDRSIDYILNKENLNNRKFAFVLDSENVDELENIIYGYDHDSKTFMEFYKKKEEKFLNVKRNLSITANYLKNQYNLNKIPNDLLYLCINKDTAKSNSMKSYNLMRVDLDVDNVRKTKNLIVIKGYGDNILIENKEAHSKNYGSIGKNNSDKKETLAETILKAEADSLELNNTNMTSISFDKFKDIFFNLPFISDLIRAGCGFNYVHDDNFIKILENLTVEIAYPERHIIRNFMFTNNQKVSLLNFIIKTK